MTALSIIVVKNPQLDPGHLDYLIDALNRQTDARFNTFWLDQCPDPAALLSQLHGQARFAWQALHTPAMTVAGVPCWELVHPFAFLMQHPKIGTHFTYLHMECLPERHFVATIRQALPGIEARYGPRFGCILQQLRSPLHLSQLEPQPDAQLRQAENLTWSHRGQRIYESVLTGGPGWFAQAWEEDAFVLPTALARELRLFDCVGPLLFFQDIFDIFYELALWPQTRFPWLRLPGAVIYHLDHERPFHELNPAFFAAVRRHPELFGHLSLYDLAEASPGYVDNSGQGSKALSELLNRIRCHERGSLRLWIEALAALYGEPQL